METVLKMKTMTTTQTPLATNTSGIGTRTDVQESARVAELREIIP